MTEAEGLLMEMAHLPHRDLLSTTAQIVFAVLLNSCQGTTLTVATPDSAEIQVAIGAAKPSDTVALTTS